MNEIFKLANSAVSLYFLNFIFVLIILFLVEYLIAFFSTEYSAMTMLLQCFSKATIKHSGQTRYVREYLIQHYATNKTGNKPRSKEKQARNILNAYLIVNEWMNEYFINVYWYLLWL